MTEPDVVQALSIQKHKEPGSELYYIYSILYVWIYVYKLKTHENRKYIRLLLKDCVI